MRTNEAVRSCFLPGTIRRHLTASRALLVYLIDVHGSGILDELMGINSPIAHGFSIFHDVAFLIYFPTSRDECFETFQSDMRLTDPNNKVTS